MGKTQTWSAFDKHDSSLPKVIANVPGGIYSALAEFGILNSSDIYRRFVDTETKVRLHTYAYMLTSFQLTLSGNGFASLV